MSNRIVYDIDGTVDLQLWSTWDHQPRGKRILNPCINPSRVKYVITGRNEIHRQYTLDGLAGFNITPKVLFMNPLGIMDFDYLLQMKAAYLTILKASVYVDDDPIWAMKLPKYWDGIICDSTMVGRYI